MFNIFGREIIISLFIVLLILFFIGLKILDYIDMSWWIVFSPLLIIILIIVFWIWVLSNLHM